MIGTSYGTAHAMATASAIPERCLGLGLNVPYLPESICREFGFWTDADMILREKQLERPWVLLPLMSLLSVFQGFLPSGIAAIPEGKKAVIEQPECIEELTKDVARSFIIGVNGQMYEMSDAETTQTWPDPRQIQVKNIAVWYAQDDSAVPPDHGKWLSGIFADTDRRNLNVKNEKVGLGHFTYMTSEH